VRKIPRDGAGTILRSLVLNGKLLRNHSRHQRYHNVGPRIECANLLAFQIQNVSHFGFAIVAQRVRRIWWHFWLGVDNSCNRSTLIGGSLFPFSARAHRAFDDTPEDNAAARSLSYLVTFLNASTVGPSPFMPKITTGS